MRTAPPVSVQGVGGRGWRVAQALLPAVTASALALWAAGWAEWPPTVAVPMACLAGAVAGVLAWRRAPKTPVRLAWDGQVWSADDRPGTLAVMLDLGAWLLLRLRPAEGHRPRWIALGAHEAGAAWHGLRAAVYSRPPDATPRVSPARVPD